MRIDVRTLHSGSGRSCPSALGRIPTVAERPPCDSHYRTFHAGNRLLIRGGVRFTLRLAGVGLSRLGRVVEPAPHTRVDVHKTCTPAFQ